MTDFIEVLSTPQDAEGERVSQTFRVLGLFFAVFFLTLFMGFLYSIGLSR